jgi:predicted RNA-binding protein YlxR (DUF448 family)
MIRWVRDDGGAVVPDLSGRSFGRGAWTHPRPDCLRNLQKSLARSFKRPVITPTGEALSLLGQGARHRVSQLLGAARRQKKAIFGSDATSEGWQRGEVYLILVARDAQAAAKSTAVAGAVAQGKACAWGTKHELGRLFGRSEIGVLGLCDRGLAKSLFGAIAMALLVQEEPESRAEA